MVRFCLALLLVVACGDPLDRFGDEVAPVLERRCATPACHGVARDDPWPNTEGYFLRLDRHGRIASAREARAATLERVSTRAPRASSLLRIPAPTWMGGGPHAGGVLFDGPDDAASDVLLDWIAREEIGGEDLELTSLERQFAADVVPVLVERCARDGCHGPSDVAFAAFPLHVVDGDLADQVAVTDVDIRSARGVVRKFLNLWGTDARQSRLVRKALGEHAGGLVHRGDRSTFFPEAPLDDPFDSDALRAILSWADAERTALGVAPEQPTAIVYVEGPASERSPYRIDTGPTGSDLFVAGWPEPGTPRNLTAALHPEGPVEIRGAALSHDASRVTFSMRRDSEREHVLWEIPIAGGEARRVSPEGAGSFVQPTYAPDERIVAAWDGHGELAADGPGVAPELVAIDGEENVERLTHTPAPEMAPGMLSSGKTRGELVFATRRRGEATSEGVLFRFPLCHDAQLHGEPEYHVQFGASVAPDAPLVARDLPDGRQLMTVLASTEVRDDRGGLALLDRSLGPDLDDPSDTSLAGFRRPFTWLDPQRRYRDPAVLPDGRFLVSKDELDAPGEDAIWVGRIVDGEGGASLGSLEPWLVRPGRSLRAALAVFPRPFEDDGHLETTDPTLPDGFLVLRDVAVLETLFSRTAPRGARTLRDDIVGVRVLASNRSLARDVRRHPEGGTTVGLSDRIPVRVLAELELPNDRSAWLRVPARVPLLVTYTDAQGMEVGRSLDRWFYAEGEETVPGGTNAPTYAHACAGCHGSMSGDPEDAATVAPDAISSASITLSTHRDRDRREALEPTTMPGGEFVDWRNEIEPVLDRCTGCHDGTAPDLLSLVSRPGVRFDAAYEAATAFVDIETLRARRSPLLERLLGEELDAPGTPEGVCPPDGPDAALVEAFTRWIEAGAFHDLEAVE